MRAHKPGWGPIVVALLGLAFLLIGVFAGVIQVARTLREARMVQALPELDAPALQSLAPGAPVAVTGILEVNEEVADAQGLVIYLEQRWTVEDTEDEGWKGAWETVYTASPACSLTLAGDSIALQVAREVVIDGTLHESRVYVPEQAQQVDGIAEGTLRHIGFKAGDKITVVGSKAAAGITPSRVFGGERKALVQHFERQVSGLRIVGGIFGLVGIGLLITAIVLWLRKE